MADDTELTIEEKRWIEEENNWCRQQKLSIKENEFWYEALENIRALHKEKIDLIKRENELMRHTVDGRSKRIKEQNRIQITEKLDYFRKE